MCFSLSRDWLYTDAEGDPLSMSTIEQLPIPDPDWGWYPISEFNAETRVIQDLDEVNDRSLGGTVQFKFDGKLVDYEPGIATTVQGLLPLKMQHCMFCQMSYPHDQAIIVAHCDTPRHRRMLSSYLRLPTTIGVSWRVPIPDSRCKVCIAARERDESEADAEAMDLSLRYMDRADEDSEMQLDASMDVTLERLRDMDI